MKKIVIIGAGYVGLSNAVLLAQHNRVYTVDIDKNKVDLINKGVSPIVDIELQQYLAERQLNLTATTDLATAVNSVDYVVIATPTDYDPNSNYFNTSSVEKSIENVRALVPSAKIVIKSTVPVGFTRKILQKSGDTRIAFSPEFLREGRALYDNLYPSRIVIGGEDWALDFAQLLVEGAIKKDVRILHTSPTEAEAIKLFSNTYLAMRVAYFNELDTYAAMHSLNAKDIVEGVSLDPRIGFYYNNPSFGYGGYCLPKDTKQLLANYKDIPQNLIHAIVQSNETRKNFIAQQVISRNPKKVGVYRLIMKAGSDNFRESSIFGVISRVSAAGIPLLVYEPSIAATNSVEYEITQDLEKMKRECDVIIANRIAEDLEDVSEKIYSRDLFGDA